MACSLSITPNGKRSRANWYLWGRNHLPKPRSTATAATIDFYDTEGTVTLRISNQNLEPNNPWLLFTPDIGDTPDLSFDSAIVRSGHEIGCSVNLQQTNSSIKRIGTSQGLPVSEASHKLFATQVLFQLSDGINSFDSYVSVQNVGDSTTEVKATYYAADGTKESERTHTIPAKASKVFFQSEAGLSAGFIGSAIFEAVDGVTSLAGAVSIYNTVEGNTSAQFLSFNTFTEGAS